MTSNEFIPFLTFGIVFLIAMVEDWGLTAFVFGLATLQVGSRIAGVQLW